MSGFPPPASHVPLRGKESAFPTPPSLLTLPGLLKSREAISQALLENGRCSQITILNHPSATNPQMLPRRAVRHSRNHQVTAKPENEPICLSVWEGITVSMAQHGGPGVQSLFSHPLALCTCTNLLFVRQVSLNIRVHTPTCAHCWTHTHMHVDV